MLEVRIMKKERLIVSGHRVDSQTIAINGYNCTFNGTGELTGFVEIP